MSVSWKMTEPSLSEVRPAATQYVQGVTAPDVQGRSRLEVILQDGWAGERNLPLSPSRQRLRPRRDLDGGGSCRSSREASPLSPPNVIHCSGYNSDADLNA